MNNFNFLRFILAFIVLLGHLIIITNNTELSYFKGYFNTYISVTGFFCISGYLIGKSFSETSSLKLYFTKRAARILPAYIFVVILSALLLSPLSTLSFSNYFTSIDLYKYLTANLLFLNFLHPDLPGIFTSPQLTSDINGALWTIKVEVMFYLAIPLIIYFLSRKKNKFTFFIIIYLISIAYKNFFEFYSTENNNFLMYARQLPGFMSYFICGIYLNYYKNTFITHKTKLVLLALPVFVIEYYFNNEIFTPIALATIIFFIAFSFPSLNFFGRKHDISYGIYIYHCPIIKTITYFGYFSQYNPYLVSLFTIVIILIVASLSWRFIEKPFLRLARNIQS